MLHFAGTYNNQYMILDLNKVKLKETIMDGALGIAEQLPGFVLYTTSIYISFRIISKFIYSDWQPVVLWAMTRLLFYELAIGLPTTLRSMKRFPCCGGKHWLRSMIPVSLSFKIYKEAGYEAYVNKTNNFLSFQLCPRAEIFRRDQSKVVIVCWLILFVS